LPIYGINGFISFVNLGADTMATMNISIPDPMKDWVQSQVETGVYANSSDYVRDLIRKDQANRNKLHILQKAITEGLESGPSDKSFDEIISVAKQALQNGH
jgi:antitoxin ParD1/3/4